MNPAISSSGAPVRASSSKRRWVRLLPSVVIVGAAVLALKTSDLIHDAYAAGATEQNAGLTAAPVVTRGAASLPGAVPLAWAVWCRRSMR